MTREIFNIERDKDARKWGALCHFFGLLIPIVAAMMIWITKRKQYQFVADQGKEALNFQITCVLISIVGMVLYPVFEPSFYVAMISMGVLVILSISATNKATQGENYRYPLNLRLIK